MNWSLIGNMCVGKMFVWKGKKQALMERTTKKQKKPEVSVEHRPKKASAKYFKEAWIRSKFEKAWTLNWRESMESGGSSGGKTLVAIEGKCEIPILSLIIFPTSSFSFVHIDCDYSCVFGYMCG